MVVSLPITSSCRLPNTRRPVSDPADRQQLSRAKFERYRDAPINGDSFVNENTKKHREWLMRIWTQYFREIGVDPDSIWIGLCEGTLDALVWCKTFLSDYVENSMRMVMVLGPEEYVKRRMLNSASSVLAMWRGLVKQADLTILEAIRGQDSSQSEKYRLRIGNTKAPRSSCLAFSISTWIWTDLAGELDLCKKLTYDKVEATREDVILILHTLYERADELGINAETRVAFHANVLMAAMGGFRPGSLGKTCYRDVILAAVREPLESTQKKYFATVRVMTNKNKDSLSIRKTDDVQFSAFFIPAPLLCLSRLIVASAIKDNAFLAEYKDEKEFLDQPSFGDVDYIHFRWKDEVLDKKIFELTYRRFNTIWHKICHLCGLRNTPKLYAMRVGSAARLNQDPLFSQALCNYIFKHTTTVFEASYQTSRLRGDLVQAAFGQSTGTDNSRLFELLRNFTLTRDPNAPASVAPGEWAEFEERNDAVVLRTAIAEAATDGDREQLEILRSRLKYLRNSWRSLKIADKRQKYFELADRLRSQGKQPPRSESHASNQAKGIRSHQSRAQMAKQISQHFDRKHSESDGWGRYIHLLLEYLKGSPKVKLAIWEEDLDNNEDDYEEDENDEAEEDGEDEDEECEEENEGGKKREEDWDDPNRMQNGQDANDGEKEYDPATNNFKCIICDLDFSSRKTLTGHYEKHLKADIFKGPFRCPKCRERRNGVDIPVSGGYLAWLSHLEKVHGQRYTPYFRQSVSLPAKYPCPFKNCATKEKGKLFNNRSLPRHISCCRAGGLKPGGEGQFQSAILCRLCADHADGDAPTIGGIWEWKQHVDWAHDENQYLKYQCLICKERVRTARGLKSHFCNLHERVEGFFSKPFLCPECIRIGLQGEPEITGRKSWQEHIERCHNGGYMAESVDAATQPPKLIPKYRCPICQNLQPHYNLKSHLRSHKTHFERPFQCPECVLERGNGELFFSLTAWNIHVSQEHQVLVKCPGVDNVNADGSITCTELRRVGWVEGEGEEDPARIPRPTNTEFEGKGNRKRKRGCGGQNNCTIGEPKGRRRKVGHQNPAVLTPEPLPDPNMGIPIDPVLLSWKSASNSLQ